jgi:hypothetical protein
VSDDEVIAQLLTEMHELWDAFDHYPLYLLTWGQNRGSQPATDLMLARAQRALDTFRAAHPATVVWCRWPIDLDQAWPLEPGTPLDFDLDADGPTDDPLMVLVPART